MASKDSPHLLRQYLDEGDVDEAFALLLAHSDRLRGYLRLRFGPWLGSRTGVELVIVETLLRAIHDPADLDGQGLELGLFRLGLETVQRRLREDAGGSQPLEGDPGDGDPAAARKELEARIDRLPEPLRGLARLDFERGGRAPLAELTERFAEEPATILEWRSQARERLMSSV